jgi:hypothetical protein
MALAPARLLGPMRAVDSRSSQSSLSAAAASSYGSSIHTRQPSLLFLLHHRSRLSSSLQFRQQHPVLCSTSSSLPDIAEEGFERAAAEAKRQTWRGGTSSSSSSSPAGVRKNASKSSDEQETAAAGGDRGGRSSSSSARYEESSRYPTHSSNSRYDSRSMHKAPWEQGPASTRGGAAGRSNSSKETKQQHLPNNRVALLRDQVEEEGASIDEEGGGGKVAMARIVDKLRSIQNNSPLGDLNPQPRQSLTANSVFLPR